MTEIRTYHGQPVIKEPTWTWEIPCYFFSGGLGGASAGLAYLYELRGEDELARRAWATAVTSLSVSPIFLISDLGRPMRFLNMLRMFKVTSPMSVGSWILVVASTGTGLAAVHSWREMLPIPTRVAAGLEAVAPVARPLAAVLGLPLSSYTAALVANTAVPAWHDARTLLPFVFVAGAAVSAGGAALMMTPVERAAAARRLSLGAAVGELALEQLMERRLGPHRKSYERGAARTFGWISRGCLAAGSALLAARGRRSRTAQAAAGGLLLAGALSTRWSVYKAGLDSAADPAFVVGPQRERLDRGQGVRVAAG